MTNYFDKLMYCCEYYVLSLLVSSNYIIILWNQISYCITALYNYSSWPLDQNEMSVIESFYKI
jgi:hypothetical protein